MTATTAAQGLNPADIMRNLVAALLIPTFLSAAGGDTALARAAAAETIDAYAAGTQPSLLAAAQIVAFGLAALGSLSLSMAEDLPLSMTLRLRNNANALNRSAEQNRRALTQTDTKPPPDRQLSDPVPKAPASQPAPTEPAPEQQHHALWAAAIADVAAEFAASLPSLPPAERELAARNAALMTRTATDLLSAETPPNQRAALAGMTTARR